MMGPKAPKSKARQVAPRPHDPNKRLPYSLSKPGQGPGETPTPPAARRIVQGCTRRIKLPGSQ